MQCGTGHYKNLMAQFSTVVEVFLQLDEQYQEVIADITQRMGAGMAKFIELEVRSCWWGVRWAQHLLQLLFVAQQLC